MSNVITSPFTVFFDRSGQPLDNGYVYIGTAGINPEVSPITVYWDSSLTTTAAQPIRTLAGYPSQSGSPGTIIINQAFYSIVVRDRNGALVFSNLNASGNFVSNQIEVKWFGAKGDGITDDTAAVQAAITYAQAASGALYFSAGTFLTTSSVTNFHNVPKVGPGAVQRGSDVFYITPTSSQTNRFYVATSGADSNDGLSSSQPLQTVQGAFDVLAKYGPSLPGTWEIILAAGTYAGLATFPENVRGQNRVLVRGPVVNHPNVPTAIIDGSSSQAFALNFNGNNKVVLSNLLLRNCTTYGWVAQDFCDITTVNVHITNITGGDGGKMQQGRIRVQGGIVQTCGAYGFNLISCTTMTIGDGAVSLLTGPTIQNCTQGGVLAQENATGHVDYTTINNCAIGLDVVGSSRIHAASCSIINNASAGVRTRMNSHWFNNGSTLSGNAINELNYSFSQEIGTAGNFISELRSTVDTTTVTLTGTTAETTMKTYSPGIIKDSFTWAGRSQRVVITGSFTGGAGTKTLRVKVGGSLVHGLVSVVSSTGFFKYDGIVRATGASSQTYDAFMLDSSATVVRGDVGTRAISMVTGADQAVTITGQLSNAGESIVINNVEIWETA